MPIPSSIMITNPKAIKVVKQIFQHFNEETKSEEYSIYFKDENRDIVWCNGRIELYTALSAIS